MSHVGGIRNSRELWVRRISESVGEQQSATARDVTIPQYRIKKQSNTFGLLMIELGFYSRKKNVKKKISTNMGIFDFGSIPSRSAETVCKHVGHSGCVL